MRLNSFTVGGLKIPNNLLLAPLAGYTNAVFREMCIRLGAGLTFTEMVSAKGLCYNSENTRELLQILQLPPEYGAVNAVQLFGCEPEYMERAACSADVAPFALIDINMGCPVPKIYKNGEGSALLNDIPLAMKMVRAAKKSGKPVSVKFRIGEVNFGEIAAAKSAVKIPVIANGGVFSPADADRLLNETGADGVMLARGAMYNPFLFAGISGTQYGDKRSVIMRQLAETFGRYDSRFATVYMRKMIAFYIKGVPNAAALRSRLLACGDRESIEDALKEIEF